MKKLIEQVTKRGAARPPEGDAAPQDISGCGPDAASQPAEPATPAPKPPPDLPLFFMLSHLDEDGPVRLDGVKLGVCEVMGLEIDEPKLGAFAGVLNALRLSHSAPGAPAPAAPGRPAGQAEAGPAGEPAPADAGGVGVPGAAAHGP